MSKDKLTDYSATAASNTDIGGINVNEGMLPSNVNNALREQMSHLADFAAGTTGIDVLNLQDDDASHSIKIQAPAAVTTTTTFTLPDGDGSASQSLTTNGSGTLSWSTRIGNVVEDITPQLGGNLDTNGNDINFGDNDKAIFGAGSDLQIYHDGTNSYVRDAGAGNLRITSDSEVHLAKHNNEYMVRAYADGAVELYYDSAEKLATTAGGVDVTGTVTADGIVKSGSTGSNGQFDLARTSDGLSVGKITMTESSQVMDYHNLLGSGIHSFSVNSTERMRIDSSGNVGIGTTSPAKTLDVDGQLRIRNGGATGYGLLEYGASSTATNNWHVGSEGDGSFRFYNGNFGAGSERMRITSGGNVGIGTASPSGALNVHNASGDTNMYITSGTTNASTTLFFGDSASTDRGRVQYDHNNDSMRFHTAGSERMRIDSSGNLLVVKNVLSATTGNGIYVQQNTGQLGVVATSDTVIECNRNGTDGVLIQFRHAGTPEGSISVSGSTVSYNGGHLSRWSRLADDSKDTSIVKGTVMTNLDEMVEWSHETTYWTDEDELPVDEDGNPTVSVGDVKTAAYVEDNEQLNKMAVSSVKGDANVAGVFVNWDTDDDDFNDMNVAMTGDMVIRIAQGTTVARGDLLMSAGDGTAKPQGDDIVRSKTIAKVTSTHVSHTYDDGSYLVPCVLMAC